MARVKSGVCEMSLLESAIFIREFWKNQFFFNGRKPVAWKMFMYYHDKVIALQLAEKREARCSHLSV